MKRLILTSLCLLFARGAFAWGQKGHDVTAYIAECRLTPEAAEKVRKALDGYSPVYIANWLDFASYWPEYAYSKTWHYLNIDEGETLESMSRNPGGDVLTAVTRLTEKLKSGRLTPEEETLSLKMLIHLVGDMHCPMHLGRLSDLGGNKRPVRFFGRDTNLHSVWDTNIPEAVHKWSYSEWQQQIDRLTDEEAAQIAAGEPADWVKETHEICKEIYGFTPEGTDISYDYLFKYTPVVERQFLRGGHRLARLLGGDGDLGAACAAWNADRAAARAPGDVAHIRTAWGDGQADILGLARSQGQAGLGKDDARIFRRVARNGDRAGRADLAVRGGDGDIGCAGVDAGELHAVAAALNAHDAVVAALPGQAGLCVGRFRGGGQRLGAALLQVQRGGA